MEGFRGVASKTQGCQLQTPSLDLSFFLLWVVWDLPASSQLSSPLSLWGLVDVPGQGSLQLSPRFWSRLGIAWREQGLVDRASPGVTGSCCTTWREGAMEPTPGWASHCRVGPAVYPGAPSLVVWLLSCRGCLASTCAPRGGSRFGTMVGSSRFEWPF